MARKLTDGERDVLRELAADARDTADSADTDGEFDDRAQAGQSDERAEHDCESFPELNPEHPW